ncbi:hypothetical protein CBNA_0997 [Coxiella burnetii str. Namibia]|nr:hypothetical protein CBNA_0997 [Coxiella burnetii str. Namibia]EDR35183.1 hypothetical protein COXBURSA334_1180 [Coxiella burnetii Q321]
MIYNSFNEAGMVAIGNVEMPVDMMLGGPMTSVTGPSCQCCSNDLC